MPKRKTIATITRDDKVAQFKEGDTVFTNKYGKCVVDYIDKRTMKTNPGLYVQDENNAPHFVNARDIILGE